VPFIPNNEPLLGLLDKFQEGRSHMAIVSRFSADKVCRCLSIFEYSIDLNFIGREREEGG
jgi:metal transporter CNNM